MKKETVLPVFHRSSQSAPTQSVVHEQRRFYHFYNPQKFLHFRG